MEARYIALIVSACIIVVAVCLIIVKYHFRNDERFNRKKNKTPSTKNEELPLPEDKDGKKDK